MPKRDFIPNIDDANAALNQLDASIETITANLTKATNDLKASTDLLAESQTEVARLKTENGTLSTTTADLEGKVKTQGEQVTKLTGELAEAKASANKTIAKAGVAPAKEHPSSGDEHVDQQAGVKQLSGLQRAMAANAAKMAAKQ